MSVRVSLFAADFNDDASRVKSRLGKIVHRENDDHDRGCVQTYFPKICVIRNSKYYQFLLIILTIILDYLVIRLIMIIDYTLYKLVVKKG